MLWCGDIDILLFQVLLLRRFEGGGLFSRPCHMCMIVEMYRGVSALDRGQGCTVVLTELNIFTFC